MNEASKTESHEIKAETTTIEPSTLNMPQTKVIKPRANLYKTNEGWLLITALPGVSRGDVELVTEGTMLTLNAPREVGERRDELRRTFRFPRGTRWGELSARWEGDLLYTELRRAEPERRSITIN